MDALNPRSGYDICIRPYYGREDGPLININEALLIRLAGVTAFGRGLHLFEEKCVHSFVTAEKCTDAVVHEQQLHKVRLRHTHRMIEGACDCEASDGIEFCHHCVAVALGLQERQAPAKSIDKRGALRRIRQHLSRLTHEALLSEFLAAIKEDRHLRDDLLQKVTLASEQLSYQELKQMIDDVSLDDYLYEAPEIRSYFQCLESMLVRLVEIAEKLDPLIFLRGVECAIRRLNEDLGLIEDFGDFRELSIDLLIDLHRKAIGRLDWLPNELASYLVDRRQGDGWHPFDDLPILYEEDLGEAFCEALAQEVESRSFEDATRVLEKYARPSSGQ